MAKGAPAKEEREPIEIPSHLKVDSKVFDDLKGDTFGGSSEILIIAENDIVGPLTYIGHRLQDLGNGLAPADIHEAKDSEGDTWRLPIATNFRRQAEGADLQRGDTFFVKRLPDVIKKRGVGAGGAMEMYMIKVTARAPRTAAA